MTGLPLRDKRVPGVRGLQHSLFRRLSPRLPREHSGRRDRSVAERQPSRVLKRKGLARRYHQEILKLLGPYFSVRSCQARMVF